VSDACLGCVNASGAEPYVHSIADEISKLTKLKRLVFKGNPIGGVIPAGLFNLTALTSLDLYQTRLRGSISNALSKLDKLIYFRADSRRFTGHLPSQWNTLTSLRSVQLRGAFNGVIDNSLIDLRELDSLIVCAKSGTLQFPQENTSSWAKLLELNPIQFPTWNILGSPCWHNLVDYRAWGAENEPPFTPADLNIENAPYFRKWSDIDLSVVDTRRGFTRICNWQDRFRNTRWCVQPNSQDWAD